MPEICETTFGIQNVLRRKTRRDSIIHLGVIRVYTHGVVQPHCGPQSLPSCTIEHFAFDASLTLSGEGIIHAKDHGNTGREPGSRFGAYRVSEVIAIYPITPSSPMGEWADQWKDEGRYNVFGTVPTVIEMQSEGGAAGTLHGALRHRRACTTFTASQGLLLMIPNMFKIAGELTPAVIHVAARTIATHALSIFGDHSDVMVARPLDLACSSCSVQEASDFALIAHSATLEARIPFLHFFDGFRTSHEVNKIFPLADEDLRAMVDEDAIRRIANAPLHRIVQNFEGVRKIQTFFFQAREAANPFYIARRRPSCKVYGSFCRCVLDARIACATTSGRQTRNASLS